MNKLIIVASLLLASCKLKDEQQLLQTSTVRLVYESGIVDTVKITYHGELRLTRDANKVILLDGDNNTVAYGINYFEVLSK